MGKRKVWAVTKGEYDDYRVCCLVETEEEAKKAVERGLGDDWEDFTLFTDGEHPKQLTIWYAAAMIISGDVQSKTWSDTEWEHDRPVTPVSAPVQVVRINSWNNRGDVSMSTYGIDREAVERAVSDKVKEIMRAGVDE